MNLPDYIALNKSLTSFWKDYGSAENVKIIKDAYVLDFHDAERPKVKHRIVLSLN